MSIIPILGQMWENPKTKNASQIAERHFGEVPSDIYK
jgi:hypothetical protein